MPGIGQQHQGKYICHLDVHVVAWARFTDSGGRVMRERMSAILEGQEGQQG